MLQLMKTLLGALGFGHGRKAAQMNDSEWNKRFCLVTLTSVSLKITDQDYLSMSQILPQY